MKLFNVNLSGKLILAGIVSLCVLQFNVGEGRRVHDPKTDTKTLPRHINFAENHEGRSIKERIREILTTAEPEEEKEEEIRFSVKETLSPNDPSIIGTPLAKKSQCVSYLLRVNPNPNIAVSAEELVSLYYREGAKEGIRPDVAFAQALKETGFFRYGGTVTPDQNNYCGLGTTSAYVKGAYFQSVAEGVRAHIQHLLAYASTRPPQEPLVDPRYSMVRDMYGERTLMNWVDLNGRWAVPGRGYGQSILSMYREILSE